MDVFTLRARRLNAGPAGVSGRLPRRPAKARDGSQRHAIFARGKAMAPQGKTQGNSFFVDPLSRGPEILRPHDLGMTFGGALRGILYLTPRRQGRKEILFCFQQLQGGVWMFSSQEREGLMEARLELAGGCHAVPPKARDGSQQL